MAGRYPAEHLDETVGLQSTPILEEVIVQSSVGVVLFDVGGVLATNGWDRSARRRASDRFGFDWEEFQDRHDFVAHDFETGALTRDDYLERTLFYRDRDFSPAEFIRFMESQTEGFDESLAVAGALADAGSARLGTLNNESRELNEYRIEALGLRASFSMFLSSCYLGVSKPDPRIYRMAIDITGYEPAECLFVDDRELNLECARREGMDAIRFTDAGLLRDELAGRGLLH